jgi:hypothetical protein
VYIFITWCTKRHADEGCESAGSKIERKGIDMPKYRRRRLARANTDRWKGAAYQKIIRKDGIAGSGRMI